MKDILTGNTPEKWEEIKTHPFYAEELAALRTSAEAYLTADIPTLRYTDLCRYVTDGNRTEYETPYFERRRRLAELAILTRLDGERYLDALSDLIWAVLEEKYWALPAHIFRLPIERRFIYTVPVEEREGHLDLFATETGALLAETLHLLGDTLSEELRYHIAREVRRRIIEPFFLREVHWLHGDDNWGAVCTAQVALCILYLGTHDEFMRAEPTFRRTLDLFLASYGEDACCTEGLAYWSYGFGSLLIYADAVRNYTEACPSVVWTEARLPKDKQSAAHDPRTGVIDYFKRPDVRAAALYPQNVYLHGGQAVSFSDGTLTYEWCRQFFYLLKREYPALVTYPPARFNKRSASAGSLGLLRNLLWSDPSAEYGAAPKEGSTRYPFTQWFIRKTACYSFAAKGGHNAEEHNHNDLGSFLLATEKGMPLADLGAAVYTRQYFEPATRYSHLVASSRGHSVPIVNGRYQEAGEQKCDCAFPSEDAFTVSFGFAYGDESVKDITRRFETDAAGVTLLDSFSFRRAPTSLVERFVSREEPRLSEGRVLLGDVALTYDPSLFTVTVEKEEYTAHNKRVCRVYLVDLAVRTPMTDAVYTFRMTVV